MNDKNPNTELAEVEARIQPETPGFDSFPAAMASHAEASMLMDPRVFEHAQRVAKVFSASNIVPAQYQGNIANCVIAMALAARMQIDVFMLMQNSYVVSGRPGFEAKLAIALANKRGPFRGPIQWTYHYDDAKRIIGCTAHATHKNGERYEATITEDVVKAEGWANKSGSKWKTMPEQMYAYRSAVFLIRKVCPEVMLGMHTTDELIDTYGDTRYIDSTATVKESPAQAQVARLKQKKQEAEPESEVMQDEVVEQESEQEQPPSDEPQQQSGGGEPEPWEQVLFLFIDKFEMEDRDAAKLNLDGYVKNKFHRDSLEECSDAELASLRIDIKTGEINKAKGGKKK